MTTGEMQQLLHFFKTMADETRLRMVGLLSDGEHNVGELAGLLNLTEPTISHHLSILRGVGLVNLRANGNQRFYRLNREMLARFGQLTCDIERIQFGKEEPEPDTSWIDAMEIDEWDKDVLKKHTADGRLKKIPSKQKKLLVVLRWLAGHFEAGRDYTEREVNAILLQYHEDYASLRRDLVDFDFLDRENGGSRYWVVSEHKED
jgi:hypothetical protein